MSKRWKRALGPTAPCAVVLTTTMGCDEPLPCQLASQDMAAPQDLAGNPGGEVTSFSCRCTDQFGTPLEGVQVTLGGRTTRTAADGSFTLTEVPVTAKVILLDASSLVPPEEKMVRRAERRVGISAPGPRRYGKIAEEVTLQAGVSLQREQPFVVPLSQPLEDLSKLLDQENRAREDITISGPEDDYDPALRHVELHIARGTKLSFPPGLPQSLSLTRVPPAMAPGTLERGAGAQLVVMIQPVGTTFDPPAELVLPVSPHASAGQRQEFMQLNLDTGRYVSSGGGTVVDEKGPQQLMPDKGTRVSRASFHLALCPPGSVQGTVYLQGKPVPGARVEVRTLDSLEEQYTTTYALPGVSTKTDAAGRYRLQGLRACSLYTRATLEEEGGTFRLSTTAFGYNNGQTITQNLSFEDTTSYRRFNLRVRVRNQDDRNKPFPGVSVYTDACMAGSCYGETNARGEVLFRDVIGPSDGTIGVELCSNRGGYVFRELQVPAQTPMPPACGIFREEDVQELDITTNCGSGSG